MAEAVPIFDQIEALAQRAEPYWRPYHEAMDEEDAFLGGDRYEDDFGQYNKDRRYIQIRGQETQDTIRHKVARITERPRTIEARPIDDDEDPDSAELAAALIESEFSNPWKMWEELREEAIQAALEHRLGVVAMDFDPECGAFGEILFRHVDSRNVIWEPGYHLHHPLCGWLRERKRLEVDYAREKFKAPWLEPDRAFSNNAQVRPGVPLIRGGSMMYDTWDDEKVTIDCWWFKNDRTVSGKQRQTGFDPLPADERYMVCAAPGAGCGYRSPTQGELKRRGTITRSLPESLDFCQGCEEMGQQGSLMRMDAREETAEVLAYKKGRRYVVHAPFAANPERKVLHDSAWPITRARSFPFYVITAYVRPGKPMGPSDTTLMWDQQVAADNLRTQMIDQVFAHKDYWGIPAVGLYDPATMQRWEGRDDQHNTFIIDQSKAEFGDLKVEHISGSGVDPNAGLVWGILNATLLQYRGIYDQGPVEDRTAKSGVALKTENAIGEIPVEHMKRREARAVGMFAGVVYDYIAATYTPARVQRLNLEGVDMLMSMWGDDLPNFDFTIGDTMPWQGLDKEKQEGFQQGMQFGQQYGPDALEAWADFNDVPRSTLRKLQKVFSAMQAAAQAGAVAPPPGADPNMDPASLQPPDGATGTSPEPSGPAAPAMNGATAPQPVGAF